MNVQTPELAPALLTVDEFEQIADSPENADRRLELIDGMIVEKAAFPEAQGLYAGNILGSLWNWATPRKLGRVGVSVRYCNGDDLHNVRMPNISLSMAKRAIVTHGSVAYLPDFAVEVCTPDDSLRKLRAKARFYIENGVKLVWLVLPETRLVEVYTADDEFTLTEADALTGDPVLPGFSLPVAAIFADPMA